jgi:RNA polymerase sigma-70 factor (ECF subfamily)
MLGRTRQSSFVPQEADDATLVHELLDQHPQAARIIWQRFASMVHGMLRRSLGRDDDIEDLTQEVFMHVFRKASTLRNPQALRAYVIAVTAFTVRNELRTRWSRRWLCRQPPANSSALLVTHQDIESREALHRLCLILDRANVEERTAFVLRVIEGMPLEDVATALNVSVATAKRRLSRAWHRVVLFAERDTALVEYVSSLKGMRRAPNVLHRSETVGSERAPGKSRPHSELTCGISHRANLPPRRRPDDHLC